MLNQYFVTIQHSIIKDYFNFKTVEKSVESTLLEQKLHKKDSTKFMVRKICSNMMKSCAVCVDAEWNGDKV